MKNKLLNISAWRSIWNRESTILVLVVIIIIIIIIINIIIIIIIVQMSMLKVKCKMEATFFPWPAQFFSTLPLAEVQ